MPPRWPANTLDVCDTFYGYVLKVRVATGRGDVADAAARPLDFEPGPAVAVGTHAARCAALPRHRQPVKAAVGSSGGCLHRLSAQSGRRARRAALAIGPEHSNSVSASEFVGVVSDFLSRGTLQRRLAVANEDDADDDRDDEHQGDGHGGDWKFKGANAGHQRCTQKESTCVQCQRRPGARVGDRQQHEWEHPACTTTCHMGKSKRHGANISASKFTYRVCQQVVARFGIFGGGFGSSAIADAASSEALRATTCVRAGITFEAAALIRLGARLPGLVAFSQ